ncbi:hypothetical protein D3C87_2003720 [compost metagenome]
MLRNLRNRARCLRGYAWARDHIEQRRLLLRIKVNLASMRNDRYCRAVRALNNAAVLERLQFAGIPADSVEPTEFFVPGR